MRLRFVKLLFLALGFFHSGAGLAHVPTPQLEFMRKEAIEALRRAHAVRPRQVYLDTMVALYHARLVVVDMSRRDTREVLECQRDPYAGFVLKAIPNIIYTCPDLHEAFRTHGASTYIPHFIHEAVHSSGVWDECEATKIQISASMDAGIAQPLVSPIYLKECGLNLNIRL